MSTIFDTVAAMQWGASSAFRGADPSRLYADRWVQANEPDTELRYAVRPLRAAARDLVRNNPYASGAVEAVADNLIGREGVRYKPLMVDALGDPARAVNWELERGWREWGDDYATVDGIESWYETERLIAKSWFTDGEVFIRHHRGFDNPHGYAIELIDPDLLDEDFNEQREQAGREIVMGVEVDSHGRPLAYHFWTEHPDSFGFRGERMRVPASEIVHHYIRYRPSQTRGFSAFAPILTTVEMIDGYTEAELVAAREAAVKMGFVESTTPEAVAAWAARMSLQNEGGKEAQPRRIRRSPGQTEYLTPGQTYNVIDPTHPNDAFDPFLTALMRGCARGAQMSYLTFTGDVSAANYSSMRAGLIPERDHWQILQGVTARRVHRKVHRFGWLPMAILTGALDLSGPPSRFAACEWRGRRWDWVDPDNDLKATEAAIKLGITSRQRAASDRGHDYETIVDESADDLAYAREAGVYVGGMNTPASKKPDAPSSNGSAGGNGTSAHANRLVPFIED